MRSYYLLSFLLFFFSEFTALSQRPWDSIDQNALPVRLEAISARHGLPNKTVNALFQDHLGFIWMGTPAGLSKYDGYTFQNYTYFRTDSLSGAAIPVSLQINAIAEDPHGNLWIGCGFAGPGEPLLLHFDRETEKLTEILLSEDISSAYKAIEDVFVGGGYVWFTAFELYRLKLPSVESAAYSNLKKDLVHLDYGMPGQQYNRYINIYEDSQGRIWSPTLQGVLKWTPVVDTFEFVQLSPAPDEQTITNLFYHHILEAENGWFWAFPVKDFIIRFHAESGSKEVIPREPRYLGTESARTRSGTLWFGRRPGLGGLTVFDPAKRRFTGIDPRVDDLLFLPNTRVLSMLQDYSDNVWIGTEYGPLLKYEPQRDQFHWVQFQANKKNVLSHNVVTGIVQDDRGQYWISTYGGGINLWDRRRNSITHLRAQSGELEGLQMDNILGLEVADDGKIWFGEGFYAGSYDPNTGKFSHKPAGGGTIFTIYEDAGHRLWLAKDTGGMGWYDPQSGQIVAVNLPNPEDTSQYLIKRPRNIYQDRLGQLWISTFESTDSGFLRFNPETKEVEVFDFPEAKAFYEDRNGYLWIGTVGGLYRYEPETGDFLHYREEDGLSSNFINAIQEDNRNCLWLATENGLSRFDPKTESFRNYFQSDGLPANEFNTSTYKNQEGELFFGGNFGLLYFHPDSIRDNQIPPKIAFTAVDLFGKRMAIDKDGPLDRHPSLTPQLRFAHWQNDLTVHFAALHFKNPAKNRYRVRLENYDPEWRDIGTQNFANYTNLDPGHYTFHVRAANSDGIWNEAGIELNITILPPWYWNGWSKMLYLLLLTGIIIGVYRFQLNRRLALAEAGRLRDLDEVKTKLYTNITHEFRTPLTVIQGTTEQIDAHETEKAIILRNSQNLLDLVNRMLDLSKIEAGKLQLELIQGNILTYLQYITESFHSLALHLKINLNFYADQDELLMDYDPGKVLQILTNLISNAIKFTPEYGKVTITARQREQEGNPILVIKVKDTGIGIAAEQLPLIFDRFHQVDTGATRRAEGAGIGLALTKELVSLMDGEIRVESRPGEGSLFTVVLPISKRAIRESLPVKSGTFPNLIFQPAGPVDQEKNGSANGLSNAHRAADGDERSLLLIVEDNLDVMQFIASCLQNNYQLMFARNGREGIALALEKIPDIIISDVMMPEVDGFELCRTLKKDERTDHIPIVLLTAKADQASRLEGLEDGADAYLVKPFHRSEVETRLRKLIELRRKLQVKFGQPGLKLEPASGPADKFILKLRQIVLDHLNEREFGVEELSRAVHLHRSQLHRKIKALTGKSTTHFIRRIRLQEGYRLLQEGNLNVSEVSYSVGFSEPAYFSKLFSQEYGLPPSSVPNKGHHTR